MKQLQRVYHHDSAYMMFPLFLAMMVLMLANLTFSIYKDSWLFAFWVLTCIACIGATVRLFFLCTNRLIIDETTIQHVFFQGSETMNIADVAAYSVKGNKLILYNQAGEEVIQVYTTLFSEHTLTDLTPFQHLKKVYP